MEYYVTIGLLAVSIIGTLIYLFIEKRKHNKKIEQLKIDNQQKIENIKNNKEVEIYNTLLLKAQDQVSEELKDQYEKLKNVNSGLLTGRQTLNSLETEIKNKISAYVQDAIFNPFASITAQELKYDPYLATRTILNNLSPQFRYKFDDEFMYIETGRFAG